MNKEDFPILNKNIFGKPLIYLDNAATSQKPKKVIEAMTSFYENDNSNVHRGIHTLSEKSTVKFEKAHETVARFIGAEKEEIIFTSGATESLNMIARMLEEDINEGDEIVLSVMEHHSNLIPWQELARRKNAVLKFILVDENYDLAIDQVDKLITEKTKIVAITQMSNVLGTINPITKIVDIAHKAGAYLIVDAAQSVPHMKIDVKNLGCDFLAFSGHKVYGPMGTGILYGRKDLLKKLLPISFGGGMVNGVTLETAKWGDLPEKFEAGTPNVVGAIGLAVAIEYIQLIGIDVIETYCRELTNYALDKLSAIPRVKIIGPGKGLMRGPVVSFTVEGIHPHDIAEMLNKNGIAVRAGHHCAMPLLTELNLSGVTRASFSFYNTKEDVDALVNSISEVKQNVLINKEISKTTETIDQELYQDNILDHYKNPHNKLEMIDCTVKHPELNPLCGDKMVLYLKIVDEVITDVSFQGDGCAISQASISMLTDLIKGKTLNVVKTYTEKDVYDLLGIPISHTRQRCALLSLKALRNGLNSLEEENA